MEKTSATTYELWWNEDKKLIDDTFDHWRQHTPPSQVSVLLEEITQPMKKIYRLLVLRYHPDKMQHASTDQEKAIFQLMTDYILVVGKRLNSITNNSGLANPSQGNSYADIMRDFLNLRKESKQQLATFAQLSRKNQRIQKEFTELSQSIAELRKQSDLQNQHMDAISHENERQKKDLADIGQSFTQARQDLADIEKQMDLNDEIDKKHYKYHTKKLAHWQQKHLENDQSLVAIRNICFHAASLDPNHPLIDTYYPRYLERKNQDNTITPIGQIIMSVIGLEYFIRIDKPEQAQSMFDSIANFEGKDQLEGYQFLFNRAQQKMKTLEPIIQDECYNPTPM